MKENIKCPVTGSDVSSLPKANYIHGNQMYSLYLSKKADVAFWEPRIFDPSYYENDSYKNQFQSHEKNLRHQPWQDFVHNQVILDKFNPGMRILDIGCGNGAFLNLLKNRSLELYGIDLDEQAIEAATVNNVKAKFMNITLDDLLINKKYKGYFDVVTMFEVIEHQVDPVIFLKKIKILLKNDGLIIGSTPNKNRLSARIGFREPFDYPPNHFFWFGEEALIEIFKRAGFKKDIITNAIKKPRLSGLRYIVISKLTKGRMQKNSMKIIPSNKRSYSFLKNLILTSLMILFSPLYPVYYLSNVFLKTTAHFGFIFTLEK